MSHDIAPRSILRKALRMDGNKMNRADDPEALRHAANNCRHMLQVLERKLADAEEHLRNGEHDRCRQILIFLRQAMPEAIAALDPDHRDNTN